MGVCCDVQMPQITSPTTPNIRMVKNEEEEEEDGW